MSTSHLPDWFAARKRKNRRAIYARKFGLSAKAAKELRIPHMDQLDRCADDSARRILLGKSERRDQS